MDALTEKNYLQRAQKGDITAFEQLLFAYENAVYSFVYNITRNQMDAEEITQDVFVKAYKNIARFRGDAKFRTWLFTIAHHTTASSFRKKRIQIQALDDSFLETSGGLNVDESLSAVGEQERNKYIKLAMEKMAPQQRELIQLFYLEELSIKEIKEITSLSETSIKTGLSRARTRLYTLMHNLLNDEIHSLL